MENWKALLYSIVYEVSADDGLRKYGLLNKKAPGSATHNSRNSGVKRKIFSLVQLKKIYGQFKVGMTYEEIADEYNLTPGAVKLKIYRYNKKVGALNANV